MPETNTFNFHIKFDGEQHSVKATTYVQSLISLTTILREVNYQLGTGKKVDINVVAEEQGSFDVLLQLIDKSTIEQLFSTDNIGVLANIVTVATGFIGIKKIINKADAEKTEVHGDNVTIKDNSGTVLYQTNKNTYNIFMTNQAAHDALSDQFRELEKDEDVHSFEINTTEAAETVQREEFEALAQRFEIPIGEEEVSTIPAKLVIVKVVFDNRDRKWDFIYNGVKISAPITDSNFWDEVDRGKSFAKGDELVADLKITKEYDTSVATFINKDYEVIDVRQHQPRQSKEQTSLDGLNEQQS